MNQYELKAIAKAAAKNIRTEAELNDFRQMLTKITVEAALNDELDDHLGYSKHEPSKESNSRNGFTSKTLQTEEGQFEVAPPPLATELAVLNLSWLKSTNAALPPWITKLFFSMPQGMSTREIVTTFKEMYDADISPTLISKVTNAVIDPVIMPNS